jgi:hypothetical protein
MAEPYSASVGGPRDHVLILGTETFNLITASGVIAAHGTVLAGVPVGTMAIGDWDNDGDNDLILVTHDSYVLDKTLTGDGMAPS